MKSNMLLINTEKFAVYSEIFGWYINIMFRKITEFLNFKLVGTYSYHWELNG